MNPVFVSSRLKSNLPILVTVIIFLTAPVITALSVCAQPNQLSLADILIALRSKKATLSDRNKILTEAINTRGTTFALTPEIEKELSVTGADRALIDSIRQRAQIAKGSQPVESKPKPEPKVETVAAPVPPDSTFYEKRAVEAVAKGDLDAALVDYTKATEMNETAVSPRMGRAGVYLAKNAYLLAIAELSKVIELDPKNAIAFARRAEAHEKQGDAALALEDHKKAFDLDPTIEPSKVAVEKHRAEEKQRAEAEKQKAEQAKLAQKPEPPLEVAPPAAVPEFVDLGQINESRAIKMVKPVFPASAARAGMGGEVTVEIELDAEGNVTKAKAVSGSPFLRQSSEDAALRSKFNPAIVGNKAVRGKARIVYNFVNKR